MGTCVSKPVDEPLAKTTPDGKGKRQGGPSERNRGRETLIMLLDFASIISEASDLLKPMKVVAESIKKILQLTKVSFNSPGE